MFNEIQDLTKRLDTQVKQTLKYGIDYATKEMEYKIAISKKALELRDSGMAVGMISLTIYGMPEVADKRCKRDTAEVIYKTSMENINSLKLQIKVLQDEAQREWGQSKNE